MSELFQMQETIEDLRSTNEDLKTREIKLLQLLRTHEALHTKILDALPINIFLENRDGQTIYANEHACKMNGMKLEELIGKTVYDFFPAKIAEQQRKIDLEVWEQRTLLTKEVKVGFLGSGNDQYLLTGKTIIHLDETDQDFMLGFGLDITDRVSAEKMVSKMAYHDPLTGLPNRRFVESFIDEFVNEKDNHEKMLGFLLLDLDRFKVINDSLGHQAGDLLLQAVANRIQASIDEEKVVSRIGGDEFVLLLPNMANEEAALDVSKNIMKLMDEPFTIYKQKVKVTTSIGISLYPYHGNDLNTLMKRADLAMYSAKEMGRNSYSLYSSEMEQLAMERLDKEILLRHA